MSAKEPVGLKAAKEKAEQYANNKEMAGTLVDKAVAKASAYKSSLKKIWIELNAFFRMIQAWRTGSYQSIPWKSLLLILASIIYFLNPFDLIMDFIPIIGFLDDISVVGFVLKSVKSDVDAFLAWEQSANSEHPTVFANLSSERS